jgi:hypothetical protein
LWSKLAAKKRRRRKDQATVIPKGSETAKGRVTGAAEKTKEPVRERAEKSKKGEIEKWRKEA